MVKNMEELTFINLDGWDCITTEEMLSKIGYKTSLVSLIAAYYDDNPNMFIRFYIPDRGVIGYLSREFYANYTRFTVNFKACVPSGYTLENEIESFDWTYVSAASSVDKSTMQYIDPSYLLIEPELDFSLQVEKYIVNNYCLYNKQPLFDVLSVNSKHIQYINFRSNHFAYLNDKIDTYHDLMGILYKNDVVIMAKENGVYFRDKSDGKFYFGEIECLDIFGDIYFRTKYYTIDSDLHKTIIPTVDVPVLLDTLELASIFASDILSTYTADKNVSAFSANADMLYKDVINKASREKSVLYKTAIRFDTPNDGLDDSFKKTASVTVTPTAYDRAITDFMLAFSVNDAWVYGYKTRNILLNSIDFNAVFYMIANFAPYHMRSKMGAYTLFNSHILLPNNGIVAAKTVMQNTTSYSIVVDTISATSIFIWVYNGTISKYMRICFMFEDNCVKVSSTDWVEKMGEHTPIHPILDSVLVSYISISLINYIRDRCIYNVVEGDR